MLLKVQILQQAGAHTEALRVLESESARAPASRSLRLAKARALVSAQRSPRRARPSSSCSMPRPRIPSCSTRWACCRCSSRSPRQPSFTSRALAAGITNPTSSACISARSPPIEAKARTHASGSARSRARACAPEAEIRSAQSLASEGRIDEARALLQGETGDPDLARRYLLAETPGHRDAASRRALALLDAALLETPEDTGLLYEAAMLANASTAWTCSNPGCVACSNCSPITRMR